MTFLHHIQQRSGCHICRAEMVLWGLRTERPPGYLTPPGASLPHPRLRRGASALKDTIAEPADRQETCSVATCERPRYRTDRYCGSHGAKLRRYGDPEWVRPTRSVDLAGMRFGSLVAIDRHDTTHWNCECDCGARTVTRTWCLTSGRAASCGDGPKHRRKDRIKYLSMHTRVTKERGRARDHPCVDCGGLASQWSYDHLDPDELYATGMSVNPIAYSMEISHYEARCTPCHKRYDLDRINAYKAST